MQATEKLEVLAAWHVEKAKDASQAAARAYRPHKIERHQMMVAHHEDAAAFLRQLAADLRTS